MRILVAGAGSVGSVLGLLLHDSGSDTVFLARDDRLEQLRKGLVVVFHGRERNAVVPVCRRPEEAGLADVVLLCVKSNSTRDVLEDIRPCVGPDTMVVSLQNGIGNEEMIAERFGEERTAGGVVVIGSEMGDDGVVRCHELEYVVVGSWGSALLDMACLGEAFGKAGIDFRVSDDIRSVKWKKMVWNSAFNPVTAITGRLVEEILDEKPGRNLVRGLMEETVLVARALGCSISQDVVRDNMNYPARYNGFRTSMQQDMLAGRKLEYEAITGTVVREARRLGIETPLNDTMYAILAAMATNHISDISSPPC